MKDIAVVILNPIQYDNIIVGIEELKKCGYDIDVYCSSFPDDPSGMNDMFNDMAKFCEKNNFNVYRNPDPNIEYKVLLEPYPCLDISAKYKIKYRYSNISAKPNIVYKPENFIMYDAILCSGDYDSNYLSVFSKTYKTSNLKYKEFKKSDIRKSDKKQLLYLPTYGNESSIEQIIDVLDEIKKQYYIVAKIHHGTNYLVNEQNRTELIKSKVDELYDSHTPLTTLLETTDVILTDNSGSIFEGIFTEIPVAVFCDDINKNKVGQFNSTQYELYKEGILPYTNSPDNVIDVIEQAQSETIVKKQREWNRTYFFHPEDFTVDFVNVVKTYLNEDFDKRYYQMHSHFRDTYYDLRDEHFQLQSKASQLQYSLDKQNNINIDLQNTVSDLSLQRDNLTKRVDLLTDKNDFMSKENTRLSNQVDDLSLKNSVLVDNIDNLNRQLNYYNSGILYRIARKIYKLKNGE